MIDWALLRNGFVEYLMSKQYNQRYMDDLLSYLDRYVTVINEPNDIIRLFSKMENGQRHLWLALRALFNYLEALGWNLEYLNGLRKALPKVKCGLDVKVPDEDSILESVGKLNKVPAKYDALYNLLLDSGLRLVEAVKVINEFKNAEKINGFHRVPIADFRGSKQAYFAYFTEETFQKMQNKFEPLDPTNATCYFRKYGIISPKYVRKFAFDKMVELEVPESVADFIQGRVARSIGARHYMSLARQADRFYQKYVEYLERLRSRLAK